MATPYRVVITADAKPAVDALNQIEDSSRRAADSLQLATRVGVGFGLVLPALSNVARGALTAADGITSLNSRLALVTGSTQAAAAVQEELFRISQESRVNFLELGNTYGTIARSAQSMGVSQERVLAVTRSIGQAMALSGGNAQGMQAALTQLSQGLGAGALRGEELNSVMEQTPRLAQALADGLGVPLGRLKALGEAGELTTDKVITALEKAGPKLAAELSQSTVTVGQSMTVLSNSATRLVGDADKATGATNSLAQAVLAVARGIDSAGSLIRENQGAFQVLAGAAAGAVGLASVGAALGGIKLAVAGIGAIMAANPVVLALLGIGAAVGVGASMLQQRANEVGTLEYKTRQLAEAQAELERRERANPGRANTVLQTRIAALTAEINAARESALKSFRAGERDTSPLPGPFPTAKSIDDARKLAKVDLDVRRKYQQDLETLNQSFAQAIFKESDPTKRGALERELQARQKALAAEYAKNLQGLSGEKKLTEAERFLETLQKQLVKLSEQTTAEQVLAEIQSGRLGTITPKLREQLLLTAQRIDAEKEADKARTEAERVQRMNREQLEREEKASADLERRQIEDRRRTIEGLLGNTQLGRARQLRAQIALLNDEFAKADPSQYEEINQALRGLQEELDRLQSKTVIAGVDIERFSADAARDIEGLFGESLQRMARGSFDGILEMWADMLLRMVVQAQAAKLFEALFPKNAAGERSGLTGGIADVIARLLRGGGGANGAGPDIAPGVPAFPSIVRGGADTGTNVLKRDMITLVHKGEAIVPEEYNPALGRGGITINNYAGAEVQTRERDDGGLDIDILARVVEQRAASNVQAGRGPLSAALKSVGLNRAAALPRMG